MKRRGFLKSLLGLAAVPVVAALPVAAPAAVVVHKTTALGPSLPLFSGEMGQWDNVRFIQSPEAARVYTAALAADLKRGPSRLLRALMERV